MKWREKARQLRSEVSIIYLALRDRRTPWYTRALFWLIIGYLLSPLDLIPDFIPVLGYLDDVVLVFVAIYLAKKMIPREVLDEYREKSR